MRKLKQTIENVSNATHILTYYVVKAFKSALINGHLMIAGYMIDQGYPFQTSKVPHTLLEILSLAQPTSATSGSGGNDIEIVQLAARETWLTPLHVSIRYGLFSCVDLLLDSSADVNAVGDGDIMPLNLAFKLRKELSGAFPFRWKTFFPDCLL
eukprot:GSChrysophyteH1.ASY1.ANO1.1080.1 assembled CDS